MPYQVNYQGRYDPESFQKITGAFGETLKYQLQAVDAIRKAKVSLSVAVMTQFVGSDKLLFRVDEEEDLMYINQLKGICGNEACTYSLVIRPISI